MKLHEEFKMYERLWEDTTEASSKVDNEVYIRTIGKREYNLLDKDTFREYIRKRFCMRGYGGNGRSYGSAEIFTMDSYINQLERVIEKIKVSLDVDMKKGLLNKSMMDKVVQYCTDIVEEYKRLNSTSKFMVVYEKDQDFYKNYVLEFCDIGNPIEAYKFIQKFGSAKKIYSLLIQNNMFDVLKELTQILENPASIVDSTKNPIKDNPDEYIEYDSYFEDLN
jgi:hypothetical protein